MVFTADQKKQIQQIKGFDALKEEYDKRMKGSGKMRGSGFWEDMWGAIKQVAGNVNTFLKNTKVISKAGKLAKYVLPEFGFAEAVPVAEAIGNFAETQGYGKKRKRVRGMGLSAIPITAGTKNKKSVLKTVMSDQMTISQNGQFQQVPKLVGAGNVGSKRNQVYMVPSSKPSTTINSDKTVTRRYGDSVHKFKNVEEANEWIKSKEKAKKTGATVPYSGKGVNQLDISPSTYNMISTNTKMKIKN